MNELKSLRQIIAEKGKDYEFEEINTEHLVGLSDGAPRVIHAILEKTAVVYPLSNSADRTVRRLEVVMVWPHDIIWRKRSAVYNVGNGLHRWDSSRVHKRNESSN